MRYSRSNNIILYFLLHKGVYGNKFGSRNPASIMGIKVFALDVVLYIMVTFAVVISIQTMGNVLVLALLVTPAYYQQIIDR